MRFPKFFQNPLGIVAKFWSEEQDGFRMFFQLSDLNILWAEQLKESAEKKEFLSFFNPVWHDVGNWKARKMLIFRATKGQWAGQGVKITRLMSIFTSNKVWKFLKKKSADKIWFNKDKGIKMSSPMPNRVKERKPDLHPIYIRIRQHDTTKW